MEEARRFDGGACGGSQLRMTVQFERFCNFQVSMEAHVITDVHHSKPQAWAPEPTSAEKHPELDNAKIQRNVKVAPFIVRPFVSIACLYVWHLCV